MRSGLGRPPPGEVLLIALRSRTRAPARRSFAPFPATLVAAWLVLAHVCVLAGCVAAPAPPAESGIDWERLTAHPTQLPGAACPYTSLYVDRPGFAYFDTPLAERAATSFAQAMVRRGFVLVDRRPEAYFVAQSVAKPSFNQATAPNWIVWWLTIEAQLELRDTLVLGVRTRPSADDRTLVTRHYPTAETWEASDDTPEYSSTSMLVDMPESEIEEAAEHAAAAIAIDLLPHVERKCSDFENRRDEREVEVEQIREALTAEMERVRGVRARQQQQRQLDLDIESPGPSAPADRGGS